MSDKIKEGLPMLVKTRYVLDKAGNPVDPLTADPDTLYQGGNGHVAVWGMIVTGPDGSALVDNSGLATAIEDLHATLAANGRVPGSEVFLFTDTGSIPAGDEADFVVISSKTGTYVQITAEADSPGDLTYSLHEGTAYGVPVSTNKGKNADRSSATLESTTQVLDVTGVVGVIGGILLEQVDFGLGSNVNPFAKGLQDSTRGWRLKKDQALHYRIANTAGGATKYNLAVTIIEPV